MPLHTYFWWWEESYWQYQRVGEGGPSYTIGMVPMSKNVVAAWTDLNYWKRSIRELGGDERCMDVIGFYESVEIPNLLVLLRCLCHDIPHRIIASSISRVCQSVGSIFGRDRWMFYWIGVGVLHPHSHP